MQGLSALGGGIQQAGQAISQGITGGLQDRQRRRESQQLMKLQRDRLNREMDQRGEELAFERERSKADREQRERTAALTNFTTAATTGVRAVTDVYLQRKANAHAERMAAKKVETDRETVNLANVIAKEDALLTHLSSEKLSPEVRAELRKGIEDARIIPPNDILKRSIATGKMMARVLSHQGTAAFATRKGEREFKRYMNEQAMRTEGAVALSTAAKGAGSATGGGFLYYPGLRAFQSAVGPPKEEGIEPEAGGAVTPPSGVAASMLLPPVPPEDVRAEVPRVAPKTDLETSPRTRARDDDYLSLSDYRNMPARMNMPPAVQTLFQRIFEQTGPDGKGQIAPGSVEKSIKELGLNPFTARGFLLMYREHAHAVQRALEVKIGEDHRKGPGWTRANGGTGVAIAVANKALRAPSMRRLEPASSAVAAVMYRVAGRADNPEELRESLAQVEDAINAVTVTEGSDYLTHYRERIAKIAMEMGPPTDATTQPVGAVGERPLTYEQPAPVVQRGPTVGAEGLVQPTPLPLSEEDEELGYAPGIDQLIAP
jgi:hypothetical protein